MYRYLFSKYSIRGIELKNRLVVSPMCQYSSKDGFANDWHLVHLGSRAVGGAGLVFTEATAVSPEGRISIDDLGIWKNDHIPYLKKITTFLEQHGAVPGIQLAHAGRKASRTAPWNGDRSLMPPDAWQVVAPSAIPFSDEYDMPAALDKEGIRKLRNDFRSAAERAIEAGFKVLEIHAAHGYLIHEFLSPITNKRIDNYGGDFENRIRILVEIVTDLREIMPEEMPLFVRLSCVDWDETGIKIGDTISLAKVLKEKGADLIDSSSGGLITGVKIPAEPGYQVPFAAAIRKNAGIPTGAVGLITTAELAESILAEGKADLIFMAREFLRDPYFALRNAAIDPPENEWPVQYLRARRK